MKKICCLIVLLTITSYLFFSPESALCAVTSGLELWYSRLLPTLLPFSILSSIVLGSNLLSLRRECRWFHPEEVYIILCGYLFGFPIGAKLTADLYSNGRLSREQAAVLLLFTNNLSPAFLLMVLHTQLPEYKSSLLLALLDLLPFLYGMLRLTLLHRQNPSTQKNTASRFKLNMQIIDAGIMNGFKTMIRLCGYIVSFSLIAEMIRQLPIPDLTIQTLLIGCMEVTNGCAELSVIPSFLRLPTATLLLSWGGLCGIAQTAALVSQTDLRIREYVITRVLLAIAILLLTILFRSLLLR